MAAVVSKYAPVAGMVFVQVAYSAMYLITRFALTRGLSHYAFVFYRQLFAAAAICPVAFYLNRDGMLSSIRWKNLWQIFLLTLIGITVSQNFYYAGLALTSSTFVSTMNNLQPAVTFLMAYILRLEQVSVKSRSGQAKIFGTLLCVGGATAMTFFGGDHDHGRGPGPRAPLLLDPAPPLRILKLLGLGLDQADGEGGGGGGAGSFLLGAFLTMTGSWSWCVFLIYQAWILEDYPSQLSLSSLVSVMGCLQVGAVALLLENPAAMALHWDMRLLVVAYSGVFCSGFGMFAIMWCVKEKGPVFATALNPLSTVLVAALEPLLLHEQLTWMSVLGIVMVIGGLYLFLWGKAGEERVDECCTNASQSMNVDVEDGPRGNEMLTGEEESIKDPLLVKK